MGGDSESASKNTSIREVGFNYRGPFRKISKINCILKGCILKAAKSSNVNLHSYVYEHNCVGNRLADLLVARVPFSLTGDTGKIFVRKRPHRRV